MEDDGNGPSTFNYQQHHHVGHHLSYPPTPGYTPDHRYQHNLGYLPMNRHEARQMTKAAVTQPLKIIQRYSEELEKANWWDPGVVPGLTSRAYESLTFGTAFMHAINNELRTDEQGPVNQGTTLGP
ncbi:hypothetical protein PCASD_15489 [Puccinia coronata f. sp. avenae]|uniref:Uncharacterized protein n=1 Tax=Puccinia coronata f. sp. avenae TaxID=200324 RepID=A0A2N5TZL1_9BASI|nr:hypothetical protein PCASD_15489 [Puccinia coronata f. sp. avenae]